ncbi:hypothetical protein M9Y10_039525 [Tritrichomonas musculus]|uniref:Uncharacterized protein n=1 Tax=Tritrichomonas musculus TaxID=1915356 RepID=A0ABR2KC48_9EUKA
MPNNNKYLMLDNKMILGKSDSSCEEYNNLVFVKRNLQNIQIPSFITKICSYALSECSIEKIYITSCITHICEGAFHKCQHHHDVEIQPDSSLQIIDKYAFLKTSIAKVSLPPTISFLGENWCDETTNYMQIQIDHNEKNVIVDKSIIKKNDIILCLRHRKKNDKFSNTLLKSSHQFNKIEIVPENKDCFSLLVTCKPQRTSAKNAYLSLVAIPNVLQMNKPPTKDRHFSIKVEFNKAFNEIHFFFKDDLNYFYSDQNMLVFYSKEKGYDNFDKIPPKNKPGSMLHVFGSYVANASTVCPIFLKNTF